MGCRGVRPSEETTATWSLSTPQFYINKAVTKNNNNNLNNLNIKDVKLVSPVKSYGDAEEYKKVVLKDNRNRSGVYR